MDLFRVGSSARVRARFRKLGALTTPTATTVTITKPDGSTLIYAYGTDAELVLESTGVFLVDQALNAAGWWAFDFVGTGACAAVNGTKIFVAP